MDIAFYQERLNLKEASFTRIDHEDAMVALVYKITKVDGTSLILKISEKKNDYFREYLFLKHLEGKLVPKIIQATPPQTGVHGAILMECLQGHLLTELTPALSKELGQALAFIHNNFLSGYGDPVDDLSNDPKDYFSLKFEEGLDECKNHLAPSLIDTCRKYFKSHFPSKVDGPCIVHRDFRPGNIIVLNGALQGIIDWAGARASFAEEDFTSIEDWINPYLNDFISGYSSIRPVPSYKPLIPFLRLNKAIATIGFLIKRNTWDTKDARLYQFNRKFIEELLSD
jgi:Ser/Thr protein kinase RdoA (MazF antagonist)